MPRRHPAQARPGLSCLTPDAWHHVTLAESLHHGACIMGLPSRASDQGAASPERRPKKNPVRSSLSGRGGGEKDDWWGRDPQGTAGLASDDGLQDHTNGRERHRTMFAPRESASLGGLARGSPKRTHRRAPLFGQMRVGTTHFWRFRQSCGLRPASDGDPAFGDGTGSRSRGARGSGTPTPSA